MEDVEDLGYVERIGVRELRQHASRYLAQVARGDSIEITVHGKPVALLVPVPEDPLEAMIVRGEAIAPTEEGDLTDEPPVDYGIDASATLAAMREDER